MLAVVVIRVWAQGICVIASSNVSAAVASVLALFRGTESWIPPCLLLPRSSMQQGNTCLAASPCNVSWTCRLSQCCWQWHEAPAVDALLACSCRSSMWPTMWPTMWHSTSYWLLVGAQTSCAAASTGANLPPCFCCLWCRFFCSLAGSYRQAFDSRISRLETLLASFTLTEQAFVWHWVLW